VGCVTDVDGEGGLRLVVPEEPEDIRTGLRRALLEGGDWRQGFSDDICIGLWLWGQWRADLEPRGLSREDFIDRVIADRRELWLWLLGDRQWTPFVTGLVGRISRRLPVGE